MITESSSFFSSHIHCLLESLNDSNSEAIFLKFSLFAQCGTDESIVILRSCIDRLDINEKDYTNVQPKPLYGLVFRYLLDRSNFSSVLAESLKGMKISVDFLANLSKALHLALHEKIGLGLALSDSEHRNIRVCGKNYCMAQIKELCASCARVDSTEQIHDILMFLHRSRALAKFVNLFKKMLSLVHLEENNQYVSAPFLSIDWPEPNLWRDLLIEDYDMDFDSLLEEMEKEINMADIIKELGCEFTTNITQCKAMLYLFFPLTEVTVARILASIACADTWLEDDRNARNSNVLVDSINQMAPEINWIRVNENLDFEGFYFPNKEAFSFFVSTFKCASQDAFPLDAICGSVWKNTKGQLSFLKYAVIAPPEIFTFAHSLRQLKYVDAVRDHKSQLGLGNHAWLCLDLLEVLCHLAECGHANDVRLLLSQPLEQCPEVLLLGMAHINTASNLLQNEVSSAVFPKMLNSSSGIDMILYLWHVNPNILLRGFLYVYNIDPDTMTRISDICQELKILSSVLDMAPSYFSIRLAAVASRRELVDLEKWTSLKLITYKDSFFEECLKFVKDIRSDAPRDIYSEDTAPIIMKVLQANASLIVSGYLLEELGKLVQTFVPAKSATKSGMSPGPSSDMSATFKPPSTSSVSATVSSSTGLDPPSRSINSERFGYIRINETLVAAAERKESPLEVPTSDTRDKIFCIINNLSASNYEAKAKDFAEILEEPYYPWFAQYMVIERVSVEPNSHDLYLKFLDKVSLRSLDKEIERATYENCRVLLESDLIKSSAEERSLLKNLGSWLGKITIGRNRVLRAYELDLKSLIIEAYEKDLMIAVIPFTSKIFESCQISIVYRPPNPYTMAIMALLSEIYTMPNTKMCLKFEIEVLFKKLEVNMNDVTPTSLLKDGVRKVEGTSDFSNKDATSSPQDFAGDAKSCPISTLNRVELPFELSTDMSRIKQKVVINPKLHFLGFSLPLHSVIPAAIEIASKEILPGISSRCVDTVTQTTKELVLKDYALVNDETQIRNAAISMAAYTAGCLARATCKEPLRDALSCQLRDVLGSNNTSEVLEEAVQLVTNDNLDLACTFIEDSVAETAIQKMEIDIAYHLYMRRKHREGIVSTYSHSSLYIQDRMNTIPEVIRPKQGHLSPSAQQVYEDFISLWKNQSGDALETGSEDIQTCSIQHDSALSTHVEAGNGISIVLKNDVSDSSRSPKSHSMETSTSGNLKGLVVASQSLPSTIATKLVISESLSTTGDALDISDEVSGLFTKWLRICRLPGVNDEACASYVLQLQQSGMLNWDDTSDRFFCFVADVLVSHCLDSEMDKPGTSQSSQQVKPITFHGLDIYAKLVVAILKFFPEDQGSNKVSLMTKVLAITVRIVQRHERVKESSFNARLYSKLFINWLHDLVFMEPDNDDDANFQVLSAFANAFHSLQPLEVPGFSFAWLELVSHKRFMPKLLTGYNQKGWPYMQRLLIDLFQFMEPSLRNAEFESPVHVLYKGTLRTLLVLLHDFPEFLCDYHFSFCDVIPPSCIQMRNIILAASPRNVKIPDPSTPNLKIDLLPDLAKSPRILSEVDAALKANQLKGDLDEYLKTMQQGLSFLTNLKQKLLLPQADADRIGTRYNVPLINSLVFYVGMQALQQLEAKSYHPLIIFIEGVALSIFQTLIMELDTEGRYLFLNAIANQLRYPNNHTHYFSFVLLLMFAESDQIHNAYSAAADWMEQHKEIVQEQITRVLLERLIVKRPHPWGLLITFIELVKNPRYNFWSKSFTKCAPEIEKLLAKVLDRVGVHNRSMST